MVPLQGAAATFEQGFVDFVFDPFLTLTKQFFSS